MPGRHGWRLAAAAALALLAGCAGESELPGEPSFYRSLATAVFLSLKLGRSLMWDAASETVCGDSEAGALLDRPYRAPWDAELRALRALPRTRP